MINKQILKLAPSAMSHIKKNLVLQVLALLFNIVVFFCISYLLYDILKDTVKSDYIIAYAIITFTAVVFRSIFVYFANKQSYYASLSVKNSLREKIYNKMVKLEKINDSKITTAQLLKLAVEGVDEIGKYFEEYLPQLFYSIATSIIIIITTLALDIRLGITMILIIPLIQISINLTHKYAQKAVSNKWNESTNLNDKFLENINGLTTLKLFNSDEYKHQQMSLQSTLVRKSSLRQLTAKQNSVFIIDLIAYLGIALIIIMVLYNYSNWHLDFISGFTIILLSVELFSPLHTMGIHFYTAANGINVEKNILEFLDLEEVSNGTHSIYNSNISINSLSYSFGESLVLDNINIEITPNSIISIVGNSGSGKSTLAKVICGINKNYQGNVTIDNKEIKEIDIENLRDNVTYLSTNSYIFKGTVRENLLIAKEDATDDELWKILKRTQLSDYISSQDGLDTMLLDQGSNLSKGQCQRLALSRALLHDSNIYIFDEATSNLDPQNENDFVYLVKQLSKTKTIIIISHRLLNVMSSDMICVLEDGKLLNKGKHEELLKECKQYKALWLAQKKMENLK